jgi:hypothetical protein
MKYDFLNHYLAISISARVAVATPTTAREIETHNNNNKINESFPIHVLYLDLQFFVLYGLYTLFTEQLLLLN